MKINDYFKTKYGLMYYEYYHEESRKDISDTIVFLHGWGMSGETFKKPVKEFLDSYDIVSVDFLGFGRSDEPNESMTIEDYVVIIYKLLDYLKIKNPIIIGHSFGGRVGIVFGNKYSYKKLFLVNTPAFKNKSFKYYYKIFKYKVKKSLLYIWNRKKYFNYVRNSGSSDYKMCSYIMKGTFKNIVRRDLTWELKRLKGNVIIISSVNDHQVLYKDSVKMYKLIDESEMYVFYKSGHFSYIDEFDKFINIIKQNI